MRPSRYSVSSTFWGTDWIHADFIVIHLVAVSDCDCRCGAIGHAHATAFIYADAFRPANAEPAIVERPSKPVAQSRGNAHTLFSAHRAIRSGGRERCAA